MLKWQKFYKNNAGVGLIEFAIVLPFLLTLVLGGIELTRYVLAHQKATNVAYAVADLITQNTALTPADSAALLSSARVMMEPFDNSPANMRVFVRSITKPTNRPPEIVWLDDWGNLAASSQIGSAEGQQVSLDGFTFVDNDQVLAVEFYYQFRSILGLNLGAFLGSETSFVQSSERFYKSAFTRPRLGTLQTSAN